MTEQKTFRFITAFAVSAVIVVFFIVITTIAAELVPSIKKWLAETFNHHWVGKSILSVALFTATSVPVFFLVPFADEKRVSRALMTLILAIVIGTVVLCAFFLYESFAR